MTENKLLNNLEAEKSVVGSVLITEGKCLDDFTLLGEDFYSVRLGKLFDLLRKRYNNQQPCDVISVSSDPDLRKMDIEVSMLYDLTGFVITAEGVAHYAELVHESAVRRRLIETGKSLQQSATDTDFAYLTESARSQIDDAIGIRKSAVSFVGDEIAQTIDSMSEPPQYQKTPWAMLNRAIGGFRNGALYTVGARPGKGKTSVGLQIAMTLSRDGAIALSSLEMSRDEIHKRIMSIGASIPMDATMNNSLSDAEWERVAVFKDAIRPNIAIDDRADVSIYDIRQFARSVSRQMPLKGVVVDYLQLMSMRDNRPRHEQVADMSRQLKILARDLNVPVVALSQLNRNSETRTDKKPSLADLRESGAIEQDSDVVILLHQEDEILLLDVAKNRQGPPAMVRLKWEGQFARAVS